MKVLSKKRKHQTAQNLLVNMSKASMLKCQALWYSSFIAVYIWFMYWVAYDFFVWHKPIPEVNPINYVGSIAAIMFIWAGTKILKPARIEATGPQQILRPKQPTPPPTQKPTPQQPPQKAIPTAVPANSACTHYLGYLNQRHKQQEIPAECFTCEHVLQCIGSTN